MYRFLGNIIKNAVLKFIFAVLMCDKYSNAWGYCMTGKDIICVLIAYLLGFSKLGGPTLRWVGWVTGVLAGGLKPSAG